MQYRKLTIDALLRLKGLERAGDHDVDALIEQVKAESNAARIFAMYQTLREILAKEIGKEAEFVFQDREGKLRKATTLEGARQAIAQNKPSDRDAPSHAADVSGVQDPGDKRNVSTDWSGLL